MPKSKKAKAAEPPPRAEDQDDEDEDDEEDEESLTMAAEAGAKDDMKVDFGFFDPRELDFHGMRALLTAGSSANSLVAPGATFDAGGLADVLCEQVEVGSVAKVVAADSEEPANPEDVLGFMSAISLKTHRKKAFAQQFCASATQRCADGRARSTLEGLLTDAGTGLIVSSRMLNLPPALVPSLVDSLMQDLAWAVEHAEDAEERAAFRFNRLLLLATVEVPAAGLPASATAASSSSDAGGGGSGGGKKRKKAAEEAAASLVEALEFARPEEEVLAGVADWSTLLNGSGRTRQLLLSLKPDAVRNAVPALHAVMADS